MPQPTAIQCRDCGDLLDESNKVYCGGRQKNRCKSCYNKVQKLWRENNPTSRTRTTRQNKIVSKYGLTLDQYDELARRQGFVCAICHNPNNIEGRELTVDHCHATNKIRGLLCHSCNLALGLIDDNITTLYSMIEYLERQEPKMSAPSITIFSSKKEGTNDR